MFEKFGEFDSAEELNEKAAELLAKGDQKGLRELAKENGIGEDDTEDYIDGYADNLANALMAAEGKLKMEAEDLELKGILVDWKDTVLDRCVQDKRVCVAVRKKGKSLKGCLALFIGYSFDKKEPVSKKILSETMVMHNGKKEKFKGDLYLGFPGKAEMKKLIEDYYLS